MFLALAGGVAWLGTPAALELAIARAIAASEGRLTVEGATGSLLSTVRVTRIAWRGDDVHVEAEGTALTWSVVGLFTKHVNVTGLGAHRLAITMKGSDAPLSQPSDLSLPLEVTVNNVGVERLEWRVGERAGTLQGVVFDYHGGAKTHAVRKLRFVADVGTLEGEAELGAVAPFTLNSTLHFTGDGAYRDTRADLALKGVLANFALDARGTSRDAAITASATLTPFSPTLLVAAHVDARDVDVARFEPTFPVTKLNVTVDAKPVAAGLAGNLTASNANVGAIDAGRVPLSALSARFKWDGRELAFDGIDARLAGDARVTGTAAFPRDGSASRWQLGVRDLDLRRVFTTLISTRLSGTLGADVAQATQTVRGDLTQAGLSLSFAATVTGRRVDIERFRGRAGEGEVTGRGRVTTDGERAFEFNGEATHFDPSRFVESPVASLTGTFSARGRLQPSWAAEASVVLAQGSHVAELPVSGNLHADVTARTLRNVAVKVAFGKTAVVLTGAAGTPADKLVFAVDAEKLQELRGLLSKYAHFPVPETIAGAARIRGALRTDPGGNGLDVSVHGTALQWGTLGTVGTLDATVAIAAGELTLDPAANESRALGLSVSATKVRIPQGDFPALAADVTGTIAHHVARGSLTGEGVDGHIQFTGGFKDTGTPGFSWAGSLDRLDNAGTNAMHLEAPAAIDWARDRLHVGNARLRVADGRADLKDFRWDAGKLATEGTVTGIPLASLLRIAGATSPLKSTLVIGGDWSIAATPQLTGVVHVKREGGDLFGTEGSSVVPYGLELGITALEIEARLSDNGVVSTGTLRSQRAGNADVTLNIKAEDGRFAPSLAQAPMTATLVADLPSLRPLQPWLGTLAVVDGRAHADLAANGSLTKASITGAVSADAMRVDIPQYGVHLREGHLRGHFADNALVLEDLSFAGGDGNFTAHGTLARAPRDGTASATQDARVTWKAEKFRAINRPDFQLTVDGTGILAIENGKVAVRGNIDILQGRIDYEPTSIGQLSDDVIIKGQPRGAANATAGRDVPLLLDLEVGLGNDLRFSGEGLDTGLAGKLHLVTGASGNITARGTISAVNGTYFVFGQRLDIERGQLIFDGPVDNPALDVTAMRRNAAVEAGVELTGTVRVPRVRLVSNPPVPDGEKLSWLMTGQGLDRASRADVAALGAASALLLGRGQRPVTTTLANSIGLDDISLRERSSTVVSGTTSQVVAFGKRINDRLTLVYEQGLTVANNALRIEYALSRSLTLRAEAGVISSLGLYFRRSYD